MKEYINKEKHIKKPDFNAGGALLNILYMFTNNNI